MNAPTIAIHTWAFPGSKNNHKGGRGNQSTSGNSDSRWNPTHHEPPRIMNPDCGSPVSHVWPPTHKTTLLPGACRLLRTASQICPPLKSQMLRLSYVRTGMLIHVYRHAIDTKWACTYVRMSELTRIVVVYTACWYIRQYTLNMRYTYTYVRTCWNSLELLQSSG